MKKKTEFSKKLCIITFVNFLFCIIFSGIAAQVGVGEVIVPYLLPSAGVLASAAVAFYFNKAKMENLSKQRLRTALIKLVLQEQIDEEVFEELCQELDDIDGTLQTKIESMYSDAVNQETDINM